MTPLGTQKLLKWELEQKFLNLVTFLPAQGRKLTCIPKVLLVIFSLKSPGYKIVYFVRPLCTTMIRM